MSDENGTDVCPNCGAVTDCETVHNGVGLLEGPRFCTSCPWTEWAAAGKVINGYLHDRAGGATPVQWPNTYGGADESDVGDDLDWGAL
jgi:hypothetical protein